jgi:hypothetical protein
MNNSWENSDLHTQIQRLYQLTIYGRWLFVIICWLTLAPFGIWQMRETISLCQEYCTWAAIRYGMQFNPFGALALIFCIAITTSVLVWQSSHILQGGLSAKEKYYLKQKVLKIKAQGSKHWLYSLIFPHQHQK